MALKNRVLDSKSALILRLLTGLLIGLALAYLEPLSDRGNTTINALDWWSITAQTLGLTAFVIWAGAGAMRRFSLLAWAIVAAVIMCGMMWFGAAFVSNRGYNDGVAWFILLPLLFICNELVSSGDQVGKWIAPYELYFDEAWKRGIQLALALLFTALFWGILWLGATLLSFIGFTWLATLLREPYFFFPVGGMAFGTAVHLSDVQTKLLANVRNLVLGVLAWLLPVITLIGGIFAVSLLFSGLALLWATKTATVTLLSGCIGFVLLINAAYQQGDIDRPIAMVLKYCVRAGALLLLVFAVLAAWSLGLRIGQYGLSPDRIFAGLGVLIALVYGIGYTAAVFIPGRWMRSIDGLNIGLAMFICALFVAILTPIAQPGRLSVADQVARLNSEKVSVEKFDWWLLKDNTGRYGKEALTALSASTNVAIAAKAVAARADKIGFRPSDNSIETVEFTEKPDLTLIPVVFPKGAALPPSFTSTIFVDGPDGNSVPSCLQQKMRTGDRSMCKAALLDLNADGQVEVLLKEYSMVTVLTQQNGKWVSTSTNNRTGFDERDFDAGRIRSLAPQWQDIVIGEQRLTVIPFTKPDMTVPSTAPKAPSPPTKSP